MLDALSDDDRKRVSFHTPEDISEYLLSLAPKAAPKETTVRGYRVRVSQSGTSAEEIRERREAVARVIARSIRDR